MSTATDYSTLKYRWAQRIVRKKIAAQLNAQESRWNRFAPLLPGHPLVGEPGPYKRDNLPPDRKSEKHMGNSSAEHLTAKTLEVRDAPPPLKVCSVGADVALGLYLALILDGQNIQYDIPEAKSRVGGRMYTQHSSLNPHEYYDVGAMRFPKIPIMKPTFDLFDHFKLREIPCYLNGANRPKLLNDHLFVKDKYDPYQISVRNGGSVPDHVVDCIDDILKEAWFFFFFWSPWLS